MRHWRRPTLLFLLLAAASAVRASPNGTAAACDAVVPRNVSFWPPGRGDDPRRLSPAVRARLARTAVAAFTPDAWAPLLAKLRRGEPITAVAVGSSIVAGYAGSFVSGAEALRSAGVSALTPTFARQLDAEGSSRSPGYLSHFMELINATWPHPGHLVINIGKGASNLNVFLDYMCTDHQLPLRSGADLLFFESHNEDGQAGHESGPGLVVAETVERLYAAMQVRLAGGDAARAIPLVWLSELPLIKGFEGQNPRQSNAALCAGDHGVHCALPSCPADVHTAAMHNASALGGFESVVTSMARRHGWAALSPHDAVAAGLRDGLPAALNLSECEFVNLFYGDPIHPSGHHGVNLLADAMLTMLLAAEDAAPPGCAPPELPPVARLAAAVTPRGDVVTPRSCLEAPDIAPSRNDSWHYVRHEFVKNVLVHKDGWLANTSGAVLEFPVRTRLDELPLAARARLSLRFLTSYEGMGAAQLACLPPCACEPETALLQGHVNGSVSVEAAADVAVTQAERCTLRLSVLDDTASGGHKVKLLGLALGVLPQATPPPPLPPSGRRRAGR